MSLSWCLPARLRSSSGRPLWTRMNWTDSRTQCTSSRTSAGSSASAPEASSSLAGTGEESTPAARPSKHGECSTPTSTGHRFSLTEPTSWPTSVSSPSTRLRLRRALLAACLTPSTVRRCGARCRQYRAISTSPSMKNAASALAHGGHDRKLSWTELKGPDDSAEPSRTPLLHAYLKTVCSPVISPADWTRRRCVISHPESAMI